MPRKCSPSWLDAYLAYTQFQEAPPIFHMWIGLTLIAASVRRNVFMDRKYFKTFPNLYTGIVGPTGDGKTTAGDIGIEILKAVPDIEIIKEKATSWYILELMDSLTTSKGHSEFFIYAPEMKTFLSDLNKTDLVTLLTSFYTCPDETESRLKQQTPGGVIKKFKNVCVNLLACSTPEWLTTGTTTDDISGGFTGRFIYAYADKTDRQSPFPEDHFSSDLMDLKQDLMDDLKHISTLKGQMLITNQAKADYISWYSTRKEECKDERLIGYYSRKRELLFKLCMLLSLATNDDMVIDDVLLKEAQAILLSAEQQMGQVFSGIVDDPTLKYKDNVLSLISRSPGHEIPRSDILRANHNRFDSLVLDRIITNLIEEDYILTTTRQGVVIYKLK